MKSKDLKPLKVSLHGMDERMQKMMANYLKLPCKGTAIVVDDDEAHAEIVDIDLSLTESLLEERLAHKPSKPIIALSLHQISIGGVIYVKKPIQVPDVLAAFGVAKDVILGKTTLETINKPTDKFAQSPSPQALNETKTPDLTRIKSSKDVSDFIQEAMQKSEATQKLAGEQGITQDVENKKVAFDDPITPSEHVKKTQQPPIESEVSEQQQPSFDGRTSPKKPTQKSRISPEIKESSTKQAPPEPVKKKSETIQPNLETDVTKKTNKTSDSRKNTVLPSETEAFVAEKTTAHDETVQSTKTPEFIKQNKTSAKSTTTEQFSKTQKPLEKTETAKASGKSKIKLAFTKSEVQTKPAHEQINSANEFSATSPGKEPKHAQEKIKPIQVDKPATARSSFPFSNFLGILWNRKGLISGLTCLFTLIAGIYIFQLTPLYEARARIFIGNSNEKNINVNSSIQEDTLDKAIVQKKINEIASRPLVGRIIKTLQLNTVPEFIAASNIADAETPTSKLREDRQAAEQLSSMTDYFLENLKASQFKSSSIINVDYIAEDPELAAKIVNQLVEKYLAIQQDKKIKMAKEITEWETNKLPTAKNKVKQSQDALALYIEMNKWSQFEQQFAEDMGVNSEIRSLEKKVKADLALYEILLKRFENLKQEPDWIETRLISSAEIPVEPSYPNKQRLFLMALLSAALIAILISIVLSVFKSGGKKVIGETI